jgi:hypothetical protein
VLLQMLQNGFAASSPSWQCSKQLCRTELCLGMRSQKRAMVPEDNLVQIACVLAC